MLRVQLDNRKKANTHKYFLADDVGFGATLRSEYLFLTDCGTRFNRVSRSVSFFFLFL